LNFAADYLDSSEEKNEEKVKKKIKPTKRGTRQSTRKTRSKNVKSEKHVKREASVSTDSDEPDPKKSCKTVTKPKPKTSFTQKELMKRAKLLEIENSKKLEEMIARQRDAEIKRKNKQDKKKTLSISGSRIVFKSKILSEPNSVTDLPTNNRCQNTLSYS